VKRFLCSSAYIRRELLVVGSRGGLAILETARVQKLDPILDTRMLIRANAFSISAAPGGVGHTGGDEVRRLRNRFKKAIRVCARVQAEDL